MTATEEDPSRARRTFARAGWRGVAYVPLTPEVERRLESWLQAGAVDDPDAVALKPGRVWRVGDLVAKFTPDSGRWRDRLRPAAALRAAERALTLPVAAPRPVLALQRGGAGFLLSEYVEGELLEDFWREDGHAMERFAEFLAALFHARVFHGDFHWRNQVWSAERDAWFLLDLEGLRHPLRTLFPRRLVIDQWARLSFCLGLPDDLRPHFERFLELARIGGDRHALWRRVRQRAQTLTARWGHPWNPTGRRGERPAVLGPTPPERGDAQQQFSSR